MPKDRPEKRFVFVKDTLLTVSGFASHDEAKAAAADIPETDERRVRVRMRSRTGLYDVVVKTRREAPDTANPQSAGKADGGP